MAGITQANGRHHADRCDHPAGVPLSVPTRRLAPLYVITDRRHAGEDGLVRLLTDIIPERGMTIQIREKDLGTRDLLRVVEAIQQAARPFRVPCVINDRVDLVLATRAAGVHLRSDSLSVKEARACLGDEYLIGASVHSPAEALQRERDGADFAVLGPVFETPSKREYGPALGVAALREAGRRCRIPLYAIGGITPARVAEVMDAGAFGVAVISSIMQAASPREAVRQYAAQFRRCGLR